MLIEYRRLAVSDLGERDRGIARSEVLLPEIQRAYGVQTTVSSVTMGIVVTSTGGGGPSNGTVEETSEVRSVHDGSNNSI